MGKLISLHAFKEKRRQRQAVAEYFGNDRDEAHFREYQESFSPKEKELLGESDTTPEVSTEAIVFDFINDKVIYKGEPVPVQGDIDLTMIATYTRLPIDEIKADETFRLALEAFDEEYPA